MKDYSAIAFFVLLVGSIPFFTDSGVVLNFVMMALYACLLAQAWNILGLVASFRLDMHFFLARAPMCK